MPRPVLHILKGGAIPDGIEALFLRHLRYLDGDEFLPEVLILVPAERIIRRLARRHIPTHCLAGHGASRGLSRLLQKVRRRHYSLIHGWGHAANMAAAPLAMAGAAKTIWSLHDIGSSAASVRIVELLNTPLSYLVPDKIVCVARATERVYLGRRYAHGRMRFIPNGVDCREFKKDPDLGRCFRQQHNIPQEAPLVGMVARNLPEKGVDIFVEASSRLRSRRPDVQFALCGWGLDRSNEVLRGELQRRGLWGCFHLFGDLEEVAPMINALDVVACCSRKESFCLSVAEAMACAKPVVAPDLGDLKDIVGDLSIIVQVGDAAAFAGGLLHLLEQPPEALEKLGSHLSDRVRSRYCLDRMVAQYHALYRELL